MSILKVFYGDKVNLKEMQIMKYLNGAGGAPRLFAVTDSAFVCESAGDINMLQYIHMHKNQDVLLDTMSKALQRVKEIHVMVISHNDIKPDNFLVDLGTGEVNHIDYDLSSKMGERALDRDHSLTLESGYWMAPEFKKGEQLSPAEYLQQNKRPGIVRKAKLLSV
ncbi:hypothetical protein SK128_013575 [Halocaridina rubra]|uniref:Protein kinase domain-containing protein n=1 Tax=Halocaridina rubra TaxID=373956 RepID=A0AAN8XJZ5_HALRR